MTQRKPNARWRSSCAMASLAIGACAVTPPPPPPPAAHTAVEAARLAQHGHGRDAAFQLCQGVACPQRTPKTMATGPDTSGSSPPPIGRVEHALPAEVRDVAGKGERTIASPSAPPRPAHTGPSASELQQLSVHFPFASAHLNGAARIALREVAPQLALAQDISLHGRTDSTGPAAANDSLAHARAEAVLRELVALAPGIASRVRVEAQGACCFIESNDGPAGRARNRRVEIRYWLDVDDPPRSTTDAFTRRSRGASPPPSPPAFHPTNTPATPPDPSPATGLPFSLAGDFT